MYDILLALHDTRIGTAFGWQLTRLPVVDIHVVAAQIARTSGNALGNTLGNEPLRIEIHPLNAGMDKGRAGLEFATSHLHRQHRILPVGIEAVGRYVHEHVFRMFLGRILRLPAALLDAAYHLAPLFALGLLGVQIVHQPTIHLARRLDFAQEKVHTIVLNLVIGPGV